MRSPGGTSQTTDIPPSLNGQLPDPLLSINSQECHAQLYDFTDNFKYTTDSCRRLGLKVYEIRRYEVKRYDTGNERDRMTISSERDSGRQNHHAVPRVEHHPYTKHVTLSCPYEVSFLELHSVTLERVTQDRMTVTADPHYTFRSLGDCFAFQSAIRRKTLVEQWEVEWVKTAAAGNAEAFREHVKVWEDVAAQHSLSFFRSNSARSRRPEHLEYPLSWFEADIAERRPGGLRLKFKVADKKSRFARRTSSNSGMSLREVRMVERC